MKRFLALLLAVGMVLSLAACGSSSSDDEDTSSDTETTEETESEEETEESESDSEDEEADTEEEESEDSEDSDSDDDSEIVYGGTLNVAYPNSFNTVYDASDPSLPATFYTDLLWNIDWDVDRDEMDYMTEYINSDYLVGQVAESWEIADDYSSMTVTIRDDVYFADKTSVGMDEEYDIYGGRQLTAEDVKYSYDRLLGWDGVEQIEVDLRDYTETLSMLDSIEVEDDYTLTFYFNTTDEISVSNFMCAWVGLCGEEWDELTEDEQNDWHYASGTGPYILTNFVNDNTMTFTANPDYWGTDSDGNQLPYLDEVNLIYVSDTSTLLASFISGEIDLICVGSFDTDEITQLKASLDEDEYYEYVYTDAYTALGLKQGNNPNEALADVTVRTAMQYALDVEALSTYMGYSYDSEDQMLSGVFGLGTDWNDVSSWSDELYESYTTYDPDYAMELLEEAGYADGFTFDVTLNSDAETDLFSLMADYLSEVGITTEFNIVTTNTEMQSAGLDADDPTSTMFSLSSTSLSTLYTSLTSYDSVQFDNDEIDSLLTDLLDATSLDEQIELAKELDQTYMEQHYLLMVTYNAVNSRFARSYVHGYSGENVTKNNYFGYTIARLWVDAEE